MQADPAVPSAAALPAPQAAGPVPLAPVPPASVSPPSVAVAPPVQVQIVQALSSAGPVTELRLAPEELGPVRIELRQEGDRLVMTIAAERPDTLDLLRRHAGELVAELRAAGQPEPDLGFGHWSGPGGDPPTPQAEGVPAEPPLPGAASAAAASHPDRPGSGLYLRI